MSASYRFGRFLLDGPGHRVLREGRPLTLTPRLVDLLRVLVEHAGAPVTKAALIDAVWPDTTVSENALAQVISDLRHALDEEPSAPRYIKTVPRRGYQFIAPVVVDAGTPSRIEVTTTSQVMSPDAERTPRPPGQRIAVLDFANGSGDQSSDWLGAGLAQTLTWDLLALRDVQILERQRVLDATDAVGSSVRAVAQEAGADLVVTGSFLRSRTRIRLSARLHDAGSDTIVADVKVEGPLEELFALQDQLAIAFARELAVPLIETPGSRLGRRETTNLEAYRAFTSGWLRLESQMADDLQASADDFRRALALDDDYALAHAGLARVLLAMYETTRADNQSATYLLDEATTHARRAVALDEGLAEAHGVLGLLLACQQEIVEAEAEARRAVMLEPGHWRHHVRLAHTTWGSVRLRAAKTVLAEHPDVAFAHIQLATVSIARGDLTHAEELLRGGAARHGQPGGRTRSQPLGLHGLLGFVHLAQRDTSSALVDFERERAFANVKRRYGREYALYAHFGRGLALLSTHQAFEALTELGAALALYPEHGPANLATAAALHALGDRARAARHLTAADDAIAVLAAHRPIEAALVRSQRLAVTGAPDAALEVLERLLADAPPGPAGWSIPIEPLLAALRPHPGFAGILAALAKRAT